MVRGWAEWWHVRLARGEAGHLMGCWARAEQVGQPGKHKAQGPTDTEQNSIVDRFPKNRSPLVNSVD